MENPLISIGRNYATLVRIQPNEHYQVYVVTTIIQITQPEGLFFKRITYDPIIIPSTDEGIRKTE